MSGILTFDDWIGADKQFVPWFRITARTTVANGWFTLHDLAGAPGALSALAVGNTANGLVPTASTPGYSPINFVGPAVGVLSSVQFTSSAAGRLMLYDRLFNAGAYAFNAAVTLASQPSYSGRIPLVSASPNYAGTQIWVECVTAMTGSLSVAVTYTNQAGTAAQTTGTVSVGALTVGRLVQLPLASGDSGVQKIESVTGTVASAGTFNVFVGRPLWYGRVAFGNSGDVHGPERTGLPQVFPTSALTFMFAADSTSSGVPDCAYVIASK